MRYTWLCSRGGACRWSSASRLRGNPWWAVGFLGRRAVGCMRDTCAFWRRRVTNFETDTRVGSSDLTGRVSAWLTHRSSDSMGRLHECGVCMNDTWAVGFNGPSAWVWCLHEWHMGRLHECGVHMNDTSAVGFNGLLQVGFSKDAGWAAGIPFGSDPDPSDSSSLPDSTRFSGAIFSLLCATVSDVVFLPFSLPISLSNSSSLSHDVSWLLEVRGGGSGILPLSPTMTMTRHGVNPLWMDIRRPVRVFLVGVLRYWGQNGGFRRRRKKSPFLSLSSVSLLQVFLWLCCRCHLTLEVSEFILFYLFLIQKLGGMNYLMHNSIIKITSLWNEMIIYDLFIMCTLIYDDYVYIYTRHSPWSKNVV